MRLNRFLAAAGLGSRRSCEELILTGQVTVNGVQCENLATTVEPSDVVKVGNRVLRTAAPVTLLLHKPPGFLCTASDTHDRRTIFDLLPPNFTRVFHVGRLDMESEGLLILTNDGELALKLTHPRFKVDKEYEVVLNRAFDFELAGKLLHGMSLEEGWAKAESVHRLSANKVKVVLRQGMKRQIRLMFYALGYEVKKLVRVRIGPIGMQNMPAASWRALTQKEIDSLLAEGAKTGAEEAAARRNAPKTRPTSRPAASKAPRGEHGEWSDRPARTPGSKRPEEIPFIPRASREEGSGRPAGRPVRPASARPTGKPASKFASKPFAAKAGKPAAKRTQKAPPKPFSKFQRRRGED